MTRITRGVVIFAFSISLAISNCFGQSTFIPLNDDYNGATQEGVGYFQQTTFKGFRWSTAKGFLRPARSRRGP